MTTQAEFVATLTTGLDSISVSLSALDSHVADAIALIEELKASSTLPQTVIDEILSKLASAQAATADATAKVDNITPDPANPLV